MNKVYYLSTCDTCKRIIKELNISDSSDFQFQDIKYEKITPAQLEEMKEMAGSYEALFSRNSRKYREWGLKNVELKEDDYKNNILKEYTFLKRPVFLIGKKVFIGNTKRNTDAVKCELNN